MRVIATKEGYDGQVRRSPGEVFDMPENAKGSWFEPHDEDAPRRGKGGKQGDKPESKANDVV